MDFVLLAGESVIGKTTLRVIWKFIFLMTQQFHSTHLCWRSPNTYMQAKLIKRYLLHHFYNETLEKTNTFTGRKMAK